MKKIISLICALAIVLGANAAPQAGKLQTLSSAKNARLEKKMEMQPKQQVATKAMKNVPFVTKKTQNVPQAVQNVKNARKAAAKAPQAKNATTDVSVIAIEAEYNSQYKQYMYVLAGEDRYFIFTFDSEGEDIITGKTYNLTDMADAYWYISTYNYSDFTAATFVKTVDENNKVKIVASATDEDGDIWNLSYDEASIPELPKGGTFVADEGFSEFYEAEEEGTKNDVYYALSVTDQNLVFYFDIYVEDGKKDVESGKTYSLTDLWVKYSYLEARKLISIQYKSVSFTKTVAADQSYTIAATIVDEEDNTWNISFSKAAPTIQEKTLTLSGEIEDFYGWFYIIEASDEAQTVSLEFWMESDNLPATMTEEDFYAYLCSITYYDEDGSELASYTMEEANFTVTRNEETGVYTITGTMKGVNSEDDLDIIIFTLNLTIAGKAPVVPSDMTFNIQVTETDIIITPSNNEDPWDYVFISKDGFAEYYDNDADAFAEAAYEYYGDNYARTGAYTISLEELSDNDMEGDLIIVVYGCNGGVTTPAATAEFTLPEIEVVPSDMTFSFNVTAEAIVVTPSNNEDPWDCMFVTPEYLAEEYNNDLMAVAEASYEDYGSQYAVTGKQELAFASMISSSFVPGEWILVVFGCNHGITTTPVAFYFILNEDGTGEAIQDAIENTNTAIKAVKRLENGQLIIEKNGTRFNVLGTIIK